MFNPPNSSLHPMKNPLSTPADFFKETLKVFFLTLSLVGTGFSQKNMIISPQGDTVSVQRPIERLVCIGHGCLRMLAYLNATDVVVGVEQQEKKELGSHVRPYLQAYPHLKKLPSIGPGTRGDAEKILACRPQLILWSEPEETQKKRLQQRTKLPVLSFDPGNLNEGLTHFIQSLRFLGALLQREQRAEEVILYFQNSLQELQQLGQQLPDSIRIYVGGIAFKGCHGLSSTHPRFTALQLLGVRNVMQDIQTISPNPVRIDLEHLIARRPTHLMIDQACLQSAQKDLQMLRSLLPLQQEPTLLWSSNSYGENWSTTLANGFKIASAMLQQGNPEQKHQQILEFLFQPSESTTTNW